jgi:hypothetical protein
MGQLLVVHRSATLKEKSPLMMNGLSTRCFWGTGS